MSVNTKINDLPRSNTSEKSHYKELLDRAHIAGLTDEATEKELVAVEKEKNIVFTPKTAALHEMSLAIDQLNIAVDSSDTNTTQALATKRVNEAFRTFKNNV